MKFQKKRSIPKQGVILLSGGIDSATTLYFAMKQGYKLSAIIFDYNQRHKKEIRYAMRLAGINDIRYYIIRAELPWTMSSLTNRGIRVPLNRNLQSRKIPLTYVPGRNIIFLSYAVSLAESINAKKIFIGAHVQDYSGYPDCRPQFMEAFQYAAGAGIKAKNIEIVAPLLNKGKKEIIELGLSLGVPFQYTWSCYQGGQKPCLKCDSCRFRIDAFRQIGVDDPILKGSR